MEYTFAMEYHWKYLLKRELDHYSSTSVSAKRNLSLKANKARGVGVVIMDSFKVHKYYLITV